MADLLEQMPGGTEVGVRDFALITLAGQLSGRFPGQLVFKGGFVLRHVHGLLRFSKDIDATRHEPPEHKLESSEVAEAIRQASIRNIVQFNPGEPASDSARSLDFDNVRVEGETFQRTSVQVEVSYREAVVKPPAEAVMGPPFYDDFKILIMTTEEMAAEKLRAVAQRLRPTDMADTYDAVIPGLFPGAPPYGAAIEIVWPRIRPLILLARMHDEHRTAYAQLGFDLPRRPSKARQASVCDPQHR